MTDFHRGVIFENHIDMKKLSQFIQDNQQKLDILSQVYIRKIKQLN